MPGSSHIPSMQYLKDLIDIQEPNGGYDYILKKISQLPMPLEHNRISSTLTSWCQRPDIDGNEKPSSSAPTTSGYDTYEQFDAKRKAHYARKAELGIK